MGNLKLQAEILQLSNYCEIIKELFHVHKELTLPKILAYSYLIKKEKLENYKIYNANNSNDVIYKSLSLLSGDASFFHEIKFIIKAIDLLVKNNILHLEGDTIYMFKDYCEIVTSESKNNSFLNKAVNESGKMSDKQFLKEVLTSV